MLGCQSQLHVMSQITVDGDTSTNDTCIGLASGAAGNDLIKHSTSEAAQKLEAAVTALLQVLPLLGTSTFCAFQQDVASLLAAGWLLECHSYTVQ